MQRPDVLSYSPCVSLAGQTGLTWSSQETFATREVVSQHIIVESAGARLWLSFWYHPVAVSSSPPLASPSPDGGWFVALRNGQIPPQLKRFQLRGLVPFISSFESLRCYIPRIPSRETHTLVGAVCNDACGIKNTSVWQPLKKNNKKKTIQNPKSSFILLTKHQNQRLSLSWFAELNTALHHSFATFCFTLLRWRYVYFIWPMTVSLE